MANENKMGYLPIKKLILQMSLPPMCSMFLQYSYNLVDSMFVANINENALAAVSLSFPITTLMISLSIWIGVGINVLIAGYLGEKEQDLADCATTLGLLVSLIVGISINILALLIIKPYFSALQIIQLLLTMRCSICPSVLLCRFQTWYISPSKRSFRVLEI